MCRLSRAQGEASSGQALRKLYSGPALVSKWGTPNAEVLAEDAPRLYCMSNKGTVS